MPLGVICNALAVMLGGILGTWAGAGLSPELRGKLNRVFGVCSIGIGISSVVLMKHMPAVILALILGTVTGVLIRLEKAIGKGGKRIAMLFPGKDGKEDNGLLITAIVLFCASGTGIYGSIVSGMSGDHSILIAKSILDLFTAMIFACTLGPAVSAIALPQLALFLALFLCARVLYPMTTPVMVDDFKACGGLIMIATGFRIAKMEDFPVADMIPAMILVWPLSWAWTNWIVPIL
ncbi:MAG: DUF554 domain-containing protein [Clostridiales bacterium]|nr:DUF554 domain-containing protein [Clostridiales bacterium]